MRDIQAHIDESDKTTKQKAASILQSISENYNTMIRERIAHEVKAAEAERAKGNDALAEHHKLMAEIYISVANAFRI